jgi:hypothetical protein
VGSQPILEVTSGEVFSHEVVRWESVAAVHDACIEDLHNVEVSISGGGADFLSEASDDIGFLQDVGFQDFEGDSGVESGGVSAIHAAESASTEVLKDDVTFNFGPREGIFGVVHGG